MRVHSLGHQTDLLLARFDGEVVVHGDHVAVRTPSVPDHPWANFVLFDRPPERGDLRRWAKTFAHEVGSPPKVGSRCFTWHAGDGELGRVRPFFWAGYQLHEHVVLAARRVHPPARPCREIDVRPLREGWEWQAAIDCQVASRPALCSDAFFRPFIERSMARYRAMSEAGLGEWFGTFVGEALVANLGVFVFEGLGRFQAVGTHPRFRRRGACGTMLHRAAEYAFERLNADTLVIVADDRRPAKGIYEGVGFTPVQRQAALTGGLV